MRLPIGHAVALFAGVLAAFAWTGLPPAFADDAVSPAMSERILDQMGASLRLQSVMTRITAFDQFGYGYQAQGGPTPISPGSERLVVFEPQMELVLAHGERITHRVWIPVDVVTNASPDAIDVVSSASRHVEGGTIDWTTTYRANETTAVSMRNGIHLENPFRSWDSGLSIRQSYADEATVVSLSALDVYDWFDHFDFRGVRSGHTDRNGTTGTVSLTQVLSPTTLVSVNYGITHQEGTMGNTWNSVPLASGVRGPELLPDSRTRHALVWRASQWLPWNGALRLYYRFYADDWGIVAHSMEGRLMQRLLPELYLGGYYRFHTQTGASFFYTLAPIDAPLRVADSDLAQLNSETVGGVLVIDLPLRGEPRVLHLEVACERYVRSNDLQMNIVSWATGFRF